MLIEWNCRESDYLSRTGDCTPLEKCDIMCRADALRHKRRAADFHIWRGLQGRHVHTDRSAGKR